jgi:hypothetical protein
MFYYTTVLLVYTRKVFSSPPRCHGRLKFLDVSAPGAVILNSAVVAPSPTALAGSVAKVAVVALVLATVVSNS